MSSKVSILDNPITIKQQDYLSRFGLSISYIKDKGRKLVAEKDFSIGDTILVNQCFCKILIAKFVSTRCYSCFTPADKLLRCSKCNRACQMKDWKFHKRECEKIELFKTLPPEARDDLMLVGRIVLAKQSHTQNSCFINDIETIPCSGDDVDLMCTNKNKVIQEEPDRITSYFSLADFAIKNEMLPPNVKDPEEVVDILLKINCNNFGIVDSLYQIYSSGVYPIGSLINHSCMSNTVVTYDKYYNQIFRCISPIVKGEEITHSYIDSMCPREERQLALKDYSFICKCPRCSDDIEKTIDFDLISDVNHKIIKSDDKVLNEKIEEIKKLRDESECLDSADERIEKLKEASDLCNKYLYKYHYLTLSVKSALLIAYSEANLIGKALFISNEVVEGFKYVYGEYHPVYALQLYTQGNLKDLLGQHHDAYVILNDARTKLLLSYLPSDPMIEDLDSYIETVKESIDQVKINHKLDS